MEITDGTNRHGGTTSIKKFTVAWKTVADTTRPADFVYRVRGTIEGLAISSTPVLIYDGTKFVKVDASQVPDHFTFTADVDSRGVLRASLAVESDKGFGQTKPIAEETTYDAIAYLFLSYPSENGRDIKSGATWDAMCQHADEQWGDGQWAYKCALDDSKNQNGNSFALVQFTHTNPSADRTSFKGVTTLDPDGGVEDFSISETSQSANVHSSRGTKIKRLN